MGRTMAGMDSTRITGSWPQLWLAPPEAAAHMDERVLDPNDSQRWAMIRRGRKAIEWAASRALLQQVGASRHGGWSLSHAANHAALCCGTGPVATGVDLEAVVPRDVIRLASLSYSPAESQAIESLPEPERLIRFYVLWTLKEALAKALRLDLATALGSCVVHCASGVWTLTLPRTEPASCVVYAPRQHLVIAAAVVGGSRGSAAQWLCKEWPGGREVVWPRLATLCN